MLSWCRNIYQANTGIQTSGFTTRMFGCFAAIMTSPAADSPPFHQRVTKGLTDTLISNGDGGNDSCLLTPQGISGFIDWFEGMEVSQIMAH